MAGLRFGCVADDFTGASDIASFFQQGRLRCVLINGLPPVDFRLDPSWDAVVIALKTRNAPVEAAIDETRSAFAWLREQGAKTLYFKYCSTFDSTRQGNIGPVLDDLIEAADLPYTILCPALPVNGRTVRNGRLYVNGVPLDQSPMRNHPINPMWDSFLPALMAPQSRYPCYVLDREALHGPDDKVFSRIEAWKSTSAHFYISVDCCDDDDGRRIAELFGDLPLLSGGSALAAFLGGSGEGNCEMMEASSVTAVRNATLILSGSCSEATQRQVASFIDGGGTAMRIDPGELIDGTQTVDSLMAFVGDHAEEDIMLYSTQPASERGEISAEEQARISQVLEKAMAEISLRAVQQGMRRIVVAGGETSGAVMRALGWHAFEIGRCVSPGVPVMRPLTMPEMRLVLKSGNFGQEDFFRRAIQLMNA